MERILVVSFNAESLPVELDGVAYLVDARQYARTTVPALREQRDTSKEPGENTLDNTGAWVRSQTDWSLGAGQEHFDLDDSDRRRFESSSGVDPWTKGELSLLPITEEKVNVTDTDLKLESIVDIVSGNTFAYYSDGQNLKYTTSVTGSTWSASTADMGYDIKDFASDGQYVYTAFGSTNALRRVQVNSTSYDAGWGGSAVNADIVAIVAGRFIGALGGNIFELNANGAKASSSLDYTATLGGTEWVDIAGGPAGIYAAANANGTGSLYHIGVNSSDGTLSTPTVAGEMPRGETINSILIYNGVLLAATSEGLRTCLVDTSSNAVTIGPVIDDGGAAHSLEVDNRFVWWGGGSGQIYRADLTKFTATLVPAWASDLVSTGGSGNVTSIARIAGKTYFGAQGDGVYGESGTGIKVASGTLTIGEVSWSTVAPKLLRSVEVRQDRAQYTFGEVDYRQSGGIDYRHNTYSYRGDPVAAFLGGIQFSATNDNNVTDTLTLSQGVPSDFTFTTQSSVSYKFVITMTRDTDDTTKGPIIADWQTTCVVTPKRVDEIIAPIVLRRQVLTSRNSGAPATYDSNEVFTSLRNRMESGVTVDYNEGARAEKVTIERLSMQPERLSDDGSWWEGTLVVRLLTVPT
tara:strand:+ start:25551 stop:27452 length:1902 start_codon:yes stop_codon:yes gene_type:complete